VPWTLITRISTMRNFSSIFVLQDDLENGRKLSFWWMQSQVTPQSYYVPQTVNTDFVSMCIGSRKLSLSDKKGHMNSKFIIAPVNLNLSTQWRYVISFPPRPLLPRTVGPICALSGWQVVHTSGLHDVEAPLLSSPQPSLYVAYTWHRRRKCWAFILCEGF
jgi:hypothetical protein